MRLFAALSLPEDVRDRLVGLQAGIPGGRLVPQQNLHLTLCFFGDVTGGKVDDLHAALSTIHAEGFDLWLDGVDVFGHEKVRQVYARVRPEPALTHLHDKVGVAARRAGIVVERKRFVPHVTLARMKPTRGDDRLSRWMIAGAALLAGPIRVEGFQLYRSTLTPGGPTYSVLADYALA